MLLETGADGDVVAHDALRVDAAHVVARVHALLPDARLVARTLGVVHAFCGVEAYRVRNTRNLNCIDPTRCE